MLGDVGGRMVLFGALEKIEIEPGSFDCVTMFDVIEHLRDPFACLAVLVASSNWRGITRPWAVF